MKKILAFIFVFIFQLSVQASPSYLECGSTMIELQYVGSTTNYDIYVSKNSLDFLKQYTNYTKHRNWALDLIYAPNNEQARQFMAKGLQESNNYTWLNTPSGSRKLWGLMQAAKYINTEQALYLSYNESIFNTEGELIGVRNDDGFEYNPLSENKGMAIWVSFINDYLRKQYATNTEENSSIY